jgi:hypothetical protein
MYKEAYERSKTCFLQQNNYFKGGGLTESKEPLTEPLKEPLTESKESEYIYKATGNTYPSDHLIKTITIKTKSGQTKGLTWNLMFKAYCTDRYCTSPIKITEDETEYTKRKVHGLNLLQEALKECSFALLQEADCFYDEVNTNLPLIRKETEKIKTEFEIIRMPGRTNYKKNVILYRKSDFKLIKCHYDTAFLVKFEYEKIAQCGLHAYLQILNGTTNDFINLVSIHIPYGDSYYGEIQEMITAFKDRLEDRSYIIGGDTNHHHDGKYNTSFNFTEKEGEVKLSHLDVFYTNMQLMKKTILGQFSLGQFSKSFNAKYDDKEIVLYETWDKNLTRKKPIISMFDFTKNQR